MKQYAIVIPIYKEDLDPIEVISLKRLFDLNVYNDVYFVAPEGLNIINYIKIFKFQHSVIYFNPDFFKSESAYSKLCLSYEFYNAFSDYEYMLIYQLDCYLFKNDIKQWCDKGYDYIGAPIVSPNSGWKIITVLNGKEKYLPKVGNGGFSLRKIETFKTLTNPNGEFRKYVNLNDEFENVEFEDVFICETLANEYDINIPSWVEAGEFAVDMNPEFVEEQLHTKDKLIGAHAIGKNIRYWKDIIPELNKSSVIDYCEDKYKEFFKLYYKDK